MSLPPELMGGMSPPSVVPSNNQPQGVIPLAPQQMPIDPAQLFAMQQQGVGGGPTEPPKPPKMLPPEFALKLANALNLKKRALSEQIATGFGPPRGMVKVDEKALLKVWRKRDPAVDIVALRMSGMSEDKLVDLAYPQRRSLVYIGRPTHAERVKFADYMHALNYDQKYASLEDEEIKTQAEIPSDLEEDAMERAWDDLDEDEFDIEEE